MNISKLFIDRPIFAGVLSVIILLAGLISIFKLPFSEYPEIIPTSVIVRAQFPGANPKVIAETVASPLEEAINGVEDMLYMQSQANSDGNLVLTVTFKLGMSPDLAQQLVENRVSQALPRLPEDVQKLGVTTIKASPVMILTVHLFSPNNKYDTKYLRNYALINVKTPLERIQGVGYAQLMGAGDYSMRVWLDPGKVAQRGMTATDVVEAIRKQNVQVAAGVIGSSPSAPNVPLQLNVNVQGRLRTESEFGSIVLKSSPSGGVTYLRDVARVELGASEYGLRSLIDDKQAVGIWVYQQPGTNWRCKVAPLSALPSKLVVCACAPLPLEHTRTLWVLHHPRYAGAYCFGRARTRMMPDGRERYARLPPEDWIALIRDAHEAYITWEQHEQNLQRLRENAQALGDERQRGAPREGPALLQGLAVCAICGERMTIRYHIRGDRRVPDYMCQRRGIKTGQPICQLVNGGPVDEAIGKLLVDAVTPVTLEMALAVQKELESRCDEGDRLRRQEVERARYEADLARRCFMHVDPGNRLVADSLEAEWNQTLRAVSEAEERYEKQKQADGAALSDKQRAGIMALAKDFPRLWNDPRTPDRERKRMARLLIADVTLLKGADIRAQVRFNGGATHTLHLSPPKSAWQLRKSAPMVVAEVDRLLETHTEAEIAELLNRKGLTSGMGKHFTD